MGIIIGWLVYALAIGLSAWLLPGIGVDTVQTALIVAVVLGLINAVLKPILILLTLPINILTLGLFSLVINALLVLLAAQIVPGFTVDGFWWALLFAVIVSAVNGVLGSLLTNGKH